MENTTGGHDNCLLRPAAGVFRQDVASANNPATSPAVMAGSQMTAGMHNYDIEVGFPPRALRSTSSSTRRRRRCQQRLHISHMMTSAAVMVQPPVAPGRRRGDVGGALRHGYGKVAKKQLTTSSRKWGGGGEGTRCSG